MTPQITLQERK